MPEEGTGSSISPYMGALESSLSTEFSPSETLKIPGIEMKYLSMGMTNSYRVAIEEGTNMVRSRDCRSRDSAPRRPRRSAGNSHMPSRNVPHIPRRSAQNDRKAPGRESCVPDGKDGRFPAHPGQKIKKWAKEEQSTISRGGQQNPGKNSPSIPQENVNIR